MKAQIIIFYLDYYNSDLSLADFAKSKNVTETEASILIDAACKLIAIQE